MAAEFELQAEVRADLGKGASRRLRLQADLVPAIIYGAGQDPQSLSIAHKDLIKATENEAFFSHILTINVAGDKQNAIIKDLQRHPSKSRILHADFQRILLDQAITVEVPFHFLNEESCVGVKTGGGQISHNMSQITISCLPGDLPEYIEVDLADVDIGEALHMSQVNLPEGVTIPALAQGADYDQVVVSVNINKRAEAEKAAEEAAEEGEDTPAAEE
ncbi:MAG: 50S ribosomal protein L25/general stress protein Ctc [Gammaproteobacteria bacterium TMED95]|jgi:large subunit ribosomal protein L25|nr:50S ribosomal protein L25/general stress protein Ctc [Gammaproteobacteria bacterium]OUV22720.1 MAG: 50S ribosomal protein L25/general stress protein Ctc [Gammaproteobacteria bacterium TMED95]